MKGAVNISFNHLHEDEHKIIVSALKSNFLLRSIYNFAKFWVFGVFDFVRTDANKELIAEYLEENDRIIKTPQGIIDGTYSEQIPSSYLRLYQESATLKMVLNGDTTKIDALL